MSLSVVKTRALIGVRGAPVAVEVHLANGLPAFNIVGLPETAVKESKDRVRAAIINSGFEFPAKRITVNLAPADLPKTGGRFDLPIAVGILSASGQLQADLNSYEFVGELALTGELRSVNGVLPTAMACKSEQRVLIVPEHNAKEVAVVSGIEAYSCASLLQVFSYLTGQLALGLCELKESICEIEKHNLDLTDVKGQIQAKRALEVAASGGHNILFVGPPGTGKSMLAARLPGIMPSLDQESALEVATIHSIKNGNFDVKGWKARPFRSPHHNGSAVALVGGGCQFH